MPYLLQLGREGGRPAIEADNLTSAKIVEGSLKAKRDSRREQSLCGWQIQGECALPVGGSPRRLPWGLLRKTEGWAGELVKSPRWCRQAWVRRGNGLGPRLEEGQNH